MIREGNVIRGLGTFEFVLLVSLRIACQDLSILWYMYKKTTINYFMTAEPPGGGGGALRYRGGPHLRYVFRGRRGLFFKTSACP